MAKLDRDNAFFGYKAPVVPIVDEQTKKAGAAAALAASSPASLAAAAASRASWAADADPYTTAIVGNTGKTQAQLDAAQGATDTAKMITDLYGSQGFTSTVDPVTGKVITKSPAGTVLGSPNQTPIGTPNPVVPKVEPKEISDATKDAFAMLADLFASYGLGELAAEISGYMTSGLTAGEALIKLKTNPNGAYATRFAGNFARVKNGLNALSEAAYMELENSYTNTLKSYGLSNMLGMDSKSNWKIFANYIANDISAVEFKDRIATVQDRVVNADPATKELFKKWYPSLTDKDLVAYFLNPTETIGKLKEKVTTAEIGAAFMGQNLSTDMTSASDLARYGIDRAGAILGASQIAEVLPEASKLGNIYEEAGITYSQKTGEEEFLKSSDEAKRKRSRLASMERGSFSGSSGNAPGAYSTGYLKKSSTAGLI
jgi:hypothetical protein